MTGSREEVAAEDDAEEDADEEASEEAAVSEEGREEVADEDTLPSKTVSTPKTAQSLIEWDT